MLVGGGGGADETAEVGFNGGTVSPCAAARTLSSKLSRDHIIEAPARINQPNRCLMNMYV